MVIRLNKSIYPLPPLKTAIRAYKHLAKFKISEKKGYFVVCLTQIDPEVKNIIKDEFCNYLLSQIKTANL